MAGRKSKYVPEIVEPLLDAIADGMTDEDACSVAGLSQTQFYHWKNTKPEFANRVTRARPRGWLTHLRTIKRAAQDDWKAAADLLDRTRSPYRKSQETIVTGPDGAPLEIVVTRRTRKAD